MIKGALSETIIKGVLSDTPNWFRYWSTRTPSNLEATTISDSRVDLTWDDAADAADGLKIYYSDDNGATWIYFASVDYGDEAASVTGLSENTLYSFRLIAYYDDYISPGIIDQQRTLPTRNLDEVEIGGYDAIITGPGTALSDGVDERSFLQLNNKVEIRQNDYLTKIKFYTQNITNVTQFYIQIWRLIDGVYTLIYEEDILTQIAGSTINIVTLTTPVSVQNGDMFGFWIDSTAQDVMFYSISAYVDSLYYENSGKRTTGYDWDSCPNKIDFLIPIKSYGQAPLIVGVGDSIMAGHSGHYSGIENSKITNVANSICGQLYSINSNYICQNMGIGGQQSTHVEARFTEDVVDLKPRMTIMLMGVNDLFNGVAKATFIAKYTSMLDECEANNIIPVVCKILPWTDGTNNQMQERDDWCIDLEVLVSTYTGAKFIDFDEDIGQFRAGGDPGNLWDIKPAYDVGGVHLNEAGYTKMAEIIDEAIRNT